MPELPEVETTRLSLLPGVLGKRITRVVLNRADLRVPFTPNMAKQLAGCRVVAIRRRAKYLLFDLDSGDTILAHLGMSGSFLVTDPEEHKTRTHEHALFYLDSGQVLVFHDPRRFGLIIVEKTKDLTKSPWLAHLGPEPLEKNFSPAYLKKVLATRKGPIKPTLMDQKIVVGVGNIYASESLFLAGIHPAMPSHLVIDDADAIIKAIRKTLNAALKSGGSTLRDFTGGDGRAGYFQHHFNVYEREGEPCVACGNEIISLVQAARTTYFCAQCQKQKSHSGKQSGKSVKK